jgi:hypothetical protein
LEAKVRSVQGGLEFRVLSQLGMARHGGAWSGEARLGGAGPGTARQGKPPVTSCYKGVTGGCKLTLLGN